MKPRVSSPINCEVCILAGGLSTRMGRDKSRLRLDHRTMLTRVRAAARRLDLPLRVIRRDLKPGCGPLGGIYTALKSSCADTVLFLACDMPFVSAALLRSLPRHLRHNTTAATVMLDGQPGFPLLLRTSALPVVADQIQRSRLSLHALVQLLKAKPVQLPRRLAWELMNVNTPADWAMARQQDKLLIQSERGSFPKKAHRTQGGRGRRNSQHAPLVKAPGHR